MHGLFYNIFLESYNIQEQTVLYENEYQWLSQLFFEFYRAYSRKQGYACNFSENGQNIWNIGQKWQNLKIFWKSIASCMRLLHAWISKNMPCLIAIRKIFNCRRISNDSFMPHFFEFYSNQRQILMYEGNYQRLYHTFALFSRSQEQTL